jgi:hypothetical protein
MSSNAIENGPSHLEANPIFSPSMPTLDDLSKPIFDPDDPPMLSFPSLTMTLEIHEHNQSIGVMKTRQMTKSGHDNGRNAWNI